MSNYNMNASIDLALDENHHCWLEMEFKIAPAEPDVGLSDPYIDWYEIISGKVENQETGDITPVTPEQTEGHEEEIESLCMEEAYKERAERLER